eukprot:SAG31_NODE_855_length_11461_cov_5.496215_12_plen_452_part_00
MVFKSPSPTTKQVQKRVVGGLVLFVAVLVAAYSVSSPSLLAASKVGGVDFVDVDSLVTQTESGKKIDRQKMNQMLDKLKRKHDRLEAQIAALEHVDGHSDELVLKELKHGKIVPKAQSHSWYKQQWQQEHQNEQKQTEKTSEHAKGGLPHSYYKELWQKAHPKEQKSLKGWSDDSSLQGKALKKETSQVSNAASRKISSPKAAEAPAPHQAPTHQSNFKSSTHGSNQQQKPNSVSQQHSLSHNAKPGGLLTEDPAAHNFQSNHGDVDVIQGNECGPGNATCCPHGSLRSCPSCMDLCKQSLTDGTVSSATVCANGCRFVGHNLRDCLKNFHDIFVKEVRGRVAPGSGRRLQANTTFPNGALNTAGSIQHDQAMGCHGLFPDDHGCFKDNRWTNPCQQPQHPHPAAGYYPPYESGPSYYPPYTTIAGVAKEGEEEATEESVEELDSGLINTK